MPSCYVRGCCNRSNKKSERQRNLEALLKRNISFHRFPQDPVLKNRWLAAICRPNATKTCVICREHFTKDCYLRFNRSQLTADACPTLKIPIMNTDENSESSVCSVTNPNEIEIDSSSQICRQRLTHSGYTATTQINKSQLSLNAIPKQNPMETSSLLKIDPMEFVDSQYDDPLGDPSDQNYSTTLPGKKSSLSMAAKSNRTSDTEFRLNFVDLLTTDNDLNGWTGVESFDSLRSLMKHIPNGENIAAGYGMSLRNLIVMVLVRTKMNIPFEQMSVLFPMKAKLLAKCFSEFLPVLEAATSTSIPAIAKSQANIQGTVLILERPVITTIGKIQRITTRKNSIRVNSAGKITAVISTSVPLPETSNDQMKSTQQQDSERIKSANISSTDFQDNMLIKVGVIEQPQPTLTKCRTAPTVPTSTASTSIAIAPAKTAECKQTIERIKSYRILNEKVAPSMTLYMDMIVRLVCGVMNFNKTTSFSDTILKW